MPKGYSPYNRNVTIDVTPTLDTDAYTAADTLGGKLTVTFALKKSVHGCTLRRINVIDDDSQGIGMKFYLYEGTPTTIADDAEYLPTIDDLKLLADVVTVNNADYVTINSNDYVIKDNLNIDFDLDNANTIEFYVATTGTPTHTAAGLTFRLTFWID
jgi:hypothetical protein